MKRLKKILTTSLLMLVLGLIGLPVPIQAATDPSMSFAFDFTVNGKETVTVELGEVIDLQLELRRTDEGKNGHYALYSMQDELIYDTRYFALVEESLEVTPAYDLSFHMLGDGVRQRLTVSRVSMSPSGARVPDEQVLLTFQLKTLSVIRDEQIVSINYKVNSRTGDTYLSKGNDLKVTVTGPGPILYAVAFEGGDERAWGIAPSVGAKTQGQSFSLPESTFHLGGYDFVGWHDGQKLYGAGDLYTMPARSVTFTARWKEVPPVTAPITTVPTPTTSATTSGSQTSSSVSTDKVTTSTTSTTALVTETDPGGFDLIVDPGDADQRKIEVEKTDQGIYLWGDDLSDLTFHIQKDGRKARVHLGKVEGGVLVKERPDGSFEILVDKDGDGVFETVVAKVSFVNKLVNWMIAAGVLLLLIAGFFFLLSRRRKESRW